LKKISIINHANPENLGDMAILYGMIRLLKETRTNVRITLFSFKPDVTKNLYKPSDIEILPSIARAATKEKFDRFSIIIDMSLFLVYSFLFKIFKMDLPCLLLTKRRIRIIDQIQKSDVVFVHGGDTISDTYGLVAATQHLYNIIICLLLSKKIVFISNTIGPFKRKIIKKIFLLILRRATLIIVRDDYSKKKLDKYNIKNKLLLDNAFYISSENIDSHRHKRILIGIVPSAMVYKFWKRRNIKNSSREYIKVFSNVINYLVRRCDNIKIFLIPHVFQMDNNDYLIANDIRKSLNSDVPIEIFIEKDPHKIKSLISTLDLLITPRMHPAIFALSTAIPVIGIDYNKKLESLFSFFDLKEYVILVEDFTFDSLIDKINLAMNNKKEIIKHLKAYKKVILEHKKDYIDTLRYILS